MKSFLAIVLLGLASFAWAESGTLVRASDLKQKPFTDAASAGKLGSGARVDIVARQGAWMQVKAGSQSGWVKLLNVRTGSGRGNGGGIGQIGSVLTTGSSGTTVTTGVKGLSSEQIRNARPNYNELKKLDGYDATRQSAANSAAANGLKARSVPYVVSRATTSDSTSGNDPQNRRRGP
ncbi:hypothetical protein [Jeongeupia naejangsanensis]|uniref:SH3 domain-containing protein n=1 Tax=Jeongeupia naejangsanensis TaxID=613195 RepID=A0ABS2BNY5_9NEIS|nr:hypothetical protein [Jeongeupia naejangsanensis]MBM3117341.1 hypothetical protein [Jeongeupia naejangsanensis]